MPTHTVYKRCQPRWNISTAYISITETDTLFLQVGFERPGIAASVIIYLAYDGIWHGENYKKTVTIELCDTAGKKHMLGNTYNIYNLFGKLCIIVFV